MPFSVGDKFGPYEILAPIGAGDGRGVMATMRLRRGSRAHQAAEEPAYGAFRAGGPRHCRAKPSSYLPNLRRGTGLPGDEVRGRQAIDRPPPSSQAVKLVPRSLFFGGNAGTDMRIGDDNEIAGALHGVVVPSGERLVAEDGHDNAGGARPVAFQMFQNPLAEFGVKAAVDLEYVLARMLVEVLRDRIGHCRIP
jgi:hypothetical protein